MTKSKAEVDVRDKIMDHLKANDRKLPWLAGKTDITYAHLYFILVRKERPLTSKNRKMINLILGTNF